MPRFEYDYTSHDDPCIWSDWTFREKVRYGWRLVSIVGKESLFIAYWEKPVNES